MTQPAPAPKAHPPIAWAKEVRSAAKDLHSLRQDVLRHNLINLGSLAFLGLAFVGTLLLGAVLNPWVYAFVGGGLIACIFFSIFILVIHECSHDMFVLHSDRKLQKKLNRAFGQLASAAFMTEYLVHWEEGHRIHHLRPCEPDDPQDAKPRTGLDLLKLYGVLLIPGGVVALNPSNQYGFSPLRLLKAVVIWTPIVAATGFLIGWHVPVTLFIGFHGVQGLNLTKKAQEHGCGLATEPWALLRSRTYFYPLRLLTSPFNINYHFEHHANFNVPWYLLPKYHQRLLKVVPEALHPYYFHREFFKQLTGRKPLPPRDLLMANITG